MRMKRYFSLVAFQSISLSLSHSNEYKKHFNLQTNYHESTITGKDFSVRWEIFNRLSLSATFFKRLSMMAAKRCQRWPQANFFPIIFIAKNNCWLRCSIACCEIKKIVSSTSTLFSILKSCWSVRQLSQIDSTFVQQFSLDR